MPGRPPAPIHTALPADLEKETCPLPSDVPHPPLLFITCRTLALLSYLRGLVSPAPQHINKFTFYSISLSRVLLFSALSPLILWERVDHSPHSFLSHSPRTLSCPLLTAVLKLLVLNAPVPPCPSIRKTLSQVISPALYTLICSHSFLIPFPFLPFGLSLSSCVALGFLNFGVSLGCLGGSVG